MTENLSLNDKMSEVQKLNKVMEIVKGWHFSVFPKFEFDYFLSKVSEFGNKPAGRAFMSRIRKVYKKEDTFEEIFKDEVKNSLIRSTIIEKPAEVADEIRGKSESTHCNIDPEKRIENNLKDLNLNKKKTIQENIQNEELIYDNNFIVEEENKDQEIDKFYENMQDNFFGEEKTIDPTQKLAFANELQDTQSEIFENKKRVFNEAFIEIRTDESLLTGGGKKLKNN
jgi:hypothetical protein